MTARARVGVALVVLAATSSVGAVPSLAAGAHDGNDVNGNVDLANANFEQHNTDVVLSVSTHGALPSLKDLVTLPSHVTSKDQRYLCLQVEGSKVGRNLYCPGGAVSHNHITLGHGTYGKSGTVKPRDDLSAKIVARGDESLSLRFSLDSAGLAPGKIDWRVVSGWTGDDCVKKPPTPPATEPAPVGGYGKSRCLDSVPDNGFETGKINKLQVAGCTSPGGLFTHGPSGKNEVALTFDDGPSSYTESVLRILDRYGVHSTFFEIGEQVSAGASAARDVLKQGSELGNHSYHHENGPGYDSLKATSNKIKQVTGFRPCEFRPPYGSVNSGLVSDANSLGMSTITWDVDPRDWSTPGSGAIYSNVTSNAHAGSIVLMHDGGGDRSQTVAALPGIIENLQGRGFKLVTVTELLGGHLKLKEAH